MSWTRTIYSYLFDGLIGWSKDWIYSNLSIIYIYTLLHINLILIRLRKRPSRMVAICVFCIRKDVYSLGIWLGLLPFLSQPAAAAFWVIEINSMVYSCTDFRLMGLHPRCAWILEAYLRLLLLWWMGEYYFVLHFWEDYEEEYAGK